MQTDLSDIPANVLAEQLRLRGATVKLPNEQNAPEDEPALAFARRHGFDARVGNAIRLTRQRRDLPRVETAGDLAELVKAEALRNCATSDRERWRALRRRLSQTAFSKTHTCA